MRWAAPGESFARLHMEQAGYPLHIIHQLRDPGRGGARGGAADRRAKREVAGEDAGVSRRRVDTLPLACLALDKLLAALKPRSVVFSAFGLREGFTIRA